MKIKTAQDIPADWKRSTFKKNTTVTIRHSCGAEKFKVSWQDAELVSDEKLDFIVIQSNGKEYPCKKDIFLDTYEAVGEAETFVFTKVRWRKKAISTLVAIPEGEEVEIETLEGVLPKVTFPDYIVIGAAGELYANTAEFVKENLEEI